MTKLNVTPEAGRLLDYVGRVALAIRMNSPYNGLYDPTDPQHAQDVMWLADALHGFSLLGNALQGGDPDKIEKACDELLHSYQLYERTDTGFKSEPGPTFERQLWLTLGEGREILMAIRDKARANAGTAA
jgi:hypothetical protein